MLPRIARGPESYELFKMFAILQFWRVVRRCCRGLQHPELAAESLIQLCFRIQ